jgi:hypothetical protein
MLRKMLSLGALVVVAVTFGVGNAAAKNDGPGKSEKANANFSQTGFSDGRMVRHWDTGGFSDGRV